MMLVRPARPEDASALVQLARTAAVGLTTLPDDEALLRKRARRSLNAMDLDIERPGDQSYLFVMEDLLTGQVGGTCGILAQTGGYEPFYSYAIRSRVHESEQLGVRNEVRALHLVKSHKGPSEVGTLFLHPDARGGGHGRLLSLARFLFVAAHPERFAREIIAEMRGVSDASGRAPFWEDVGRHFFQVEFGVADAQSARDKSFIGEMMPQHPIYIPMLPPDVQAVIGQVHPATRPALRLLEQEGFRYEGEVDIFDAGPLVRAPAERVRTIAESRVAPLAEVGPSDAAEGSLLIANDGLAGFRCCLGAAQVRADGGLVVPRDVALALGARIGDPLRYVSARPARTESDSEPSVLPPDSTESS